jgi:hypothetical protein
MIKKVTAPNWERKVGKMSYSRWSGSVWYTYNAYSEATTKSGEVFEICAICNFTYAQKIWMRLIEASPQSPHEAKEGMDENFVFQRKAFTD